MSGKPRVLMIAALGDPPYVGGIENVVETLLHCELSERFELSAFDTYRTPDPNRTRLAKASYAARLSFACRAHLRNTKPDVVHIHFCSRVDFWKHAICLILAKRYRAKTVFHLHGGAFGDFLDGMTPPERSLAKLAFGRADRVIALSSYWKTVLTRVVAPERIRILSNPIDCERLAPHPRSTDPHHPTVLLLGRLGKGKGHYDVLEALPAVVKEHPNVTVLFAGNDDEPGATADLERVAESLGVRGHVEFLGPVSFGPKVRLLQASTMMILPSYVENMPLSVLEAMAARMPVVASRAGALPEVLDGGKAGLLIDAGDPQALAASINRLLDDPSFAAKLGEVAGERARRSWDVKRVARQVEALYRELIA